MGSFCKGFVPSRSDPDRTENTLHHVNVETRHAEMRLLGNSSVVLEDENKCCNCLKLKIVTKDRDRLEQERKSPNILMILKLNFKFHSTFIV